MDVVKDLYSEICLNQTSVRGRHGRDHMVVDLQLTVQSVPITTKVVSSNPIDEV
jgi:hypothetical protein